MAGPLFIAGRVVAKRSRRRLAGVTVEALATDGGASIAQTTTDEAGVFFIDLADNSLGERLTDANRPVSLAVCQDGARLPVDWDGARWTTATADRLVTIEVNDDVVSPEIPVWLQVDSLEALTRHQDAILARIAETPNGGWLFTIHPFLLLADVGVEVSDEVRDEILARHPHLCTPSAPAYQAIRGRSAVSTIRVRLTGLFEKDSTR